MGFWARTFGRSATSKREGEQLAEVNTVSILTGRNVTEETALQHSAVWACVKLLSETIGSLPLNVYEKTEKGRKIADDFSLQKILNISPNAYMTSVEFLEAVSLNAVMHGNGYAVIEKNVKGQVVALNTLPQGQTKPRILKDGSLVYEYDPGDSSALVIYSADSILHIKGMGNGLVGLSPFSYSSSAVGLAMNAEDFATKYYVNGGKPGGALVIDKILTEDQRTELRKSFSKLTEGAENAHKLMVLEAGMRYEQIQSKPEDLQMIETRRFQLEDIARFYGVPSFLINDTEKTTTWGSGIEHMMLGFYTLTIRPYINRWEQALSKALLTPQQRRKYEIEFDFEDLLRGDMAGRASYASQMVQNGIQTRNEVRKKMKLAPVDGGETLTAQTNLATLENINSGNVQGATNEPQKPIA